MKKNSITKKLFLEPTIFKKTISSIPYKKTKTDMISIKIWLTCRLNRMRFVCLNQNQNRVQVSDKPTVEDKQLVEDSNINSDKVDKIKEEKKE